MPRTTQEAMLAAIAADPADDTARLAYADWCDEFDRPQEACEQRLAACLRRVVAEPDDDAPRLEYADVCARYGRAERAEFIRVQCERDRIPSSRQGNTRAQRRRRAKLWERERELWDAPGAVPIPDGVGSVQTLWRRGFIEAVEVTAETWLTHGDAIAAKHPVREVTLATWPTITNVVDWHRGHPDGRSPFAFYYETARKMFAARWPGVRFEFPPEGEDAGWDETDRLVATYERYVGERPEYAA